MLYRAATRLTGVPRGDLRNVLDLLATEGAGRLAEAVGKTRAPHEEQPRPLRMLVEALEATAVRSGAGRWQPSWDHGQLLVDTSGTALELQTLAARAVRSARDVPSVRAQLAALGIDEAAGRPGSPVPAAIVGELIGMITNVRAAMAPKFPRLRAPWRIC